MLNYIWGGLIISSLLFAVVSDVGDLTRDAYRNGQPLPVEVAFPEGYDADRRSVPVSIRIDPGTFREFYGVEAAPSEPFSGVLRQSQEGVVLRFDGGSDLPDPLSTIQVVSQSRDEELQGSLVDFAPLTGVGGSASAGLVFEEVRFVKMNAISQAALDFAETAAEISLGLIGVLALFLGLLKIAEDAGVIYALVRLVRPVLKPLFPGIPDDHPALGMIALNMAANVFGLGNAATPFGIKAMEELQTLNPSEDTATDDMVMLLAINTASVQLVPPVLLLALMGLQINQLIFAIIITTSLSLVIAITAAKLYSRLPGARASNPLLHPPIPATASGPPAPSSEGEG